MATENFTTVQIDTDANGTIDITSVINEGETVFVDGGILTGATVDANKPVHVNVLTADRLRQL